MEVNAAPPPGDKKVLKTGTFLKCFCPHCRVSLIRNEEVVFGVERAKGERGELHLSPRLNVFDSTSSITLPEGEEVSDLFCPICRASLKVPDKGCEECGSHVARFWIRVDAENIEFYICLRKNCFWHGVSEEARQKMMLDIAGFKQPADHTEMIRTGTKLLCFCPRCHGSLVEGDDLVVNVLDKAGKVGKLKLSPYLNVFRSESSLFLPPGEEVQDMICPKCKQSLWMDDMHCELCGSRAARFEVRASVLNVDFYICMRKECHWHGLSEHDRRRIILDESMEW